MILLERFTAALLGCAEALLLLLAALEIGRALLGRAFRVPDGGAIAELVLGLGALSALAYILGAFGLFPARLSWVALALGGLSVARHRSALLPTRDITRPGVEVLPSLLAIALSLGAPVVFWDCRAYHLAIPEFLIHTGSLVNATNYVYGFYAQASEMLYAYLLPLPHGETATQALNVLLLAAAVHAATERLAPGDRSPAMTLLISLPGLLMLAFLPKNVALLTLCGVAACEEAFAPTDEGRKRREIIAGGALGIALATHYAALLVAPFVLFGLLRRRGRRAALTALAVAIAFSAPTFIRDAALTGNPLYPYFSFLFGAGLSSTRALGLETRWLLPGELLERAGRPWGMTFESLGVGSTFGPLFLLGLVIAAIGLRKAKDGRALHHLTGLTLVLFTSAFYSRPRFGLTGLFLLAGAAARGISRLGAAGRVLILAQSTLAAFLLLTGPLDPLAPIRLESDDAYAARFDPAWPLAVEARQSLPKSARIASAGVLRSYGWRGMLEPACEDLPPALEGILNNSSTGAEAARKLRALGYTHLLADEQEMARLARQYRYLVMDEKSVLVWRELLERSTALWRWRSATLYALPD